MRSKIEELPPKPPEERWLVAVGELTTGTDPTPRLSYMVTLLDAEAPEFHPVLDCRHRAQITCAVMNALRWSEDEYLDHASEMANAVESGRPRRFIREQLSNSRKKCKKS